MPDPSRLKCYVDLDGVLVDFEKGYETASGRKCGGPDDDTFWEPVIRTPDFWINLEWMPGGQKLWEYVRQHHYVTILSSPGNHDKERAITQKRQWVRKYLGEDVNIVFKYSKEKHHYACEHSILIDDWGENIVRWKNAGGIAVHHRGPVERTIRDLQRQGLFYTAPRDFQPEDVTSPMHPGD